MNWHFLSGPLSYQLCTCVQPYLLGKSRRITSLSPQISDIVCFSYCAQFNTNCRNKKSYDVQSLVSPLQYFLWRILTRYHLPVIISLESEDCRLVLISFPKQSYVFYFVQFKNIPRRCLAGVAKWLNVDL